MASDTAVRVEPEDISQIHGATASAASEPGKGIQIYISGSREKTVICICVQAVEATAPGLDPGVRSLWALDG